LPTARPSIDTPLPENAPLVEVGGRPSRRPAREGWQQILREGLELIGSQDYEAAITPLSRALVEAPDDAIARCYAARGYAYLCLGDFDRAIIDSNQAIDLNANDGEAYACRGSAYAGNAQWRNAIHDYEAAIRLTPAKALEYEQIVNSHLEEALSDLTEEIAANKTDPTPYRDRSAVHVFSGNYKAAVADLTRAVELAEDAPELRVLRAECFLALNQRRNVIADCTHALKHGAQTAKVYLMRARALRHVEKLDHAVADYTRLLKLDSSQAQAYFERGEVYRQLGKDEEALADYDNAIARTPDNFDYRVVRGKHRSLLGDHEGAVDDFARAIQLDNDDPEPYVLHGEALIELGQHDMALDDFDAAISRDAVCARAFRGRGRAFYFQGDFELGRKELNKALRLDLRYTDAYDTRGDIYLQLGEYESAASDFTKLIEIEPDRSNMASVHYRRGRALLENGKYKEALADFDTSLALEADNADAFAWRGAALSKLSRFGEALESILAACQLSPADAEGYRDQARPWIDSAIDQLTADIANDDSNADLFRHRAAAHQFENNINQAFKDFSAALKLEPDDRHSRLQRAAILESRDKFEVAAKDYTRAIKLGDDEASTYLHRGICLRKLKQHKSALADLDKAIQRDPKLKDAHLIRGLLHVKLNATAKAVRDLSTAIEADNENPEPYFERGVLFKAAGKFAHATRDFSQAIRLGIATARSFYLRGECHVQLRQFEEAIADFNEAIRLEPMGVAAYCSRGLAFARRGRPQRALIELTKAASQIGDDAAFAAAFDCRGRVFYNMGHFKKAIDDHTIVLQVDPGGYDFCPTYYGLALAQFQSKLLDEAVESLKKALEKQPGFQPAKNALHFIQAEGQELPSELRPPTKTLPIPAPPQVRRPLEVQKKPEWDVELLWDQWLVIGKDGREYGPISKADLDAWCGQGRLTEKMSVWRIDWESAKYAGEVYYELLYQTHKSANRPIPMSQVPQEEFQQDTTHDSFELNLGRGGPGSTVVDPSDLPDFGTDE